MKSRILNCSDLSPVENTNKICIIFSNFLFNSLSMISIDTHFNSKYLLFIFSLFLSRMLLKVLQEAVTIRLHEI